MQNCGGRGGGGEPAPLLLDEALVHADRRRMRAALDELGRLGQDNQIILFSKDEALAERAEKAEHWTIIRLPGPSLVSPSLDAPPTNGAARFASALSPAQFRRTFTEVTIGDAASALARSAAPLARAEGFELHAQSMEARIEENQSDEPKR